VISAEYIVCLLLAIYCFFRGLAIILSHSATFLLETSSVYHNVKTTYAISSKDNYKEWGMAVAVGHLVKYSKWEVQGTTIIEFIDGDNFDISLGIEYTSKELHLLEEKATAEEEKNKL